MVGLTVEHVELPLGIVGDGQAVVGGGLALADCQRVGAFVAFGPPEQGRLSAVKDDWQLRAAIGREGVNKIANAHGLLHLPVVENSSEIGVSYTFLLEEKGRKVYDFTG